MKNRETPIEFSSSDFKSMGYQLVDAVSDFLGTIREKPITRGETPAQLQKLLNSDKLAEKGTDPAALLATTTDLLIDHSLFNGHPKFLGYITSSPAPLGTLAELLASTINANVGAQILSPMATEIEKQTIRWIADFVGVSKTWDGILVSGGNMANFTAFLAARTAKAGKDFKAEGVSKKKLMVYCSRTTHTWIEKAMVLFGHGTNALRWIETEDDNRLRIPVLKNAIEEDLMNGHQPFMVVGTAGDVSTGVVDDLATIAVFCIEHDVWFHVDGAYGGPAAILPELKDLFSGLEEADSIALDPHKWLYSPLEAGCTLVKNPKHLIDTYSSHPEYYNFSKNEGIPARNFFEYGLQNSRGFRALKVWLVLQQLGRSGYVQLIREDIALSKLLFQLADQHPELEAVTQNLSITTLRYIPADIDAIENKEVYLNTLNETLLDALQIGGKVFLSNAVVKGAYCLRGCIVNFRTSEKDIEEIIEIVVQEGRAIHQKRVM